VQDFTLGEADRNAAFEVAEEAALRSGKSFNPQRLRETSDTFINQVGAHMETVGGGVEMVAAGSQPSSQDSDGKNPPVADAVEALLGGFVAAEDPQAMMYLLLDSEGRWNAVVNSLVEGEDVAAYCGPDAGQWFFGDSWCMPAFKQHMPMEDDDPLTVERLAAALPLVPRVLEELGMRLAQGSHGPQPAPLRE
jgi:hypothetical protein